MGFSVKFVIFSIVLLLAPSLGWCKRQEVPEVTKRQLESLIKTEDYLAVFWCKLNFMQSFLKMTSNFAVPGSNPISYLIFHF